MDIFSNLGSGELIFILLIILLVMGPHRLPEVAKVIGQTLHQIQKAYQGFVSEFDDELRTVEEATKEVQESIQTLQETADSTATLVKSGTGAVTEQKPVPELIDALPAHDLAPQQKAKGDGLPNG
ncbi:MAG: twin-arginine translocase TatA/TatE family subunit [Anaerolineae bacterium]|jgi:Tat protein translocase TatB subunit|nr:twin-arginine translocase TatA/TatE family subunit [Anaerolineae bacterium]MDH7473620.1 twin-arginine translocase TatA/TatE family subunit [Anaerolineae bacterium]